MSGGDRAEREREGGGIKEERKKKNEKMKKCSRANSALSFFLSFFFPLTGDISNLDFGRLGHEVDEALDAMLHGGGRHVEFLCITKGKTVVSKSMKRKERKKKEETGKGDDDNKKAGEHILAAAW